MIPDTASLSMNIASLVISLFYLAGSRDGVTSNLADFWDWDCARVNESCIRTLSISIYGLVHVHVDSKE